MLCSLISKVNKTKQASEDLGTFLAENIYLIIGLIIGIVVVILMRKTFKTKP